MPAVDPHLEILNGNHSFMAIYIGRTKVIGARIAN